MRVGVVYFDKLLGAARTQLLVKLLFSAVFNLFRSFQTFFRDFRPEINKPKKDNFRVPTQGVDQLLHVDQLYKQKRLKTAEKISSTSFWVRAAPKSWSKYTTSGGT